MNVMKEAKKSGNWKAYFSKAEPDKLFIDEVLYIAS